MRNIFSKKRFKETPSLGVKGEIGDTGTSIYEGVITEEYNPKLQGIKGIKIYEEMRKSDATVKASIRICTLPIRAAKWSIEPASEDGADKEVAEFVEKNLFDGMTITWDDFLRQALLMLPLGVMLFEKVYQDVDFKGATKLGLRKLAPRLPKGVQFWITEKKKDGITWLKIDGSQVSIPIEKLVVFVNNKEGDNWWGEALGLDVSVPTLDGWKLNKDLKIGDRIFDENGHVSHVIATKEWANRPVYEIKFSNGEKIIADKNHKWFVEQGVRRVPKIMTTEEMAKRVKLRANNKSGTVSNFAIPVCKPVEYVKQSYLIDPYVLGWWLSDGTSACAEITSKDKETKKLLEDTGYELIEKKMPKEHAMTYRLKKLQLQLKVLNLLGNKHIPDNYKFGSVKQRLDLVQGLMDGDGTIDKWNRCEFDNTNKNIVDGLREILASLGIKSRCQEIDTSRNPNSRKNIFRVHFLTILPVFRLPRKLKKQRKFITGKSVRYKRLFIESINPVGKRTTKCIETDAESHLYLCGKGFIPTHNSLLRASYKHWFFKNTYYKIDAIAFERQGLGVPFARMPENADDKDERAAEKVLQNIRANEKAFALIPNNYEMGFLDMHASTLKNPAEAIKHHNREILLSALAAFLDLGSGTQGSYALSKDQSSGFFLSLVAVANYICDTVNRYVIKQLVDLNFDVKNYPELTYGNIGYTNLTEISAAISSLVTAGIIEKDEKLERHIRDLFGFPEKAEEVEITPVPEEEKKDKFNFAEPFKSWRELEFNEKQVHWKSIEENMDFLENEFAERARAIVKGRTYKKGTGEEKRFGKKTEKLAGKRKPKLVEFRKEIERTMRRAFDFGKSNLANNLRTSTPAKTAKDKASIKKQALEMTKYIREQNKTFGETIDITKGIIVATAINQGRRKVLKANRDMIYALRRSEILDRKTCRFCWDMDKRVFDQDDPFTNQDIFHPRCRGIWTPILKGAEKLPRITGIPDFLRKEFGKIGWGRIEQPYLKIKVK